MDVISVARKEKWLKKWLPNFATIVKYYKRSLRVFQTSANVLETQNRDFIFAALRSAPDSIPAEGIMKCEKGLVIFN